MHSNVDLRKQQVQEEALRAIKLSGKPVRAILGMATGVGKSKIAIDFIQEKFKKVPWPKKILLVVPTEKLRDDNWRVEFDRWNAGVFYAAIERMCYASINKIEGQHYDIVILDELQNITPNNYEFFKKNDVVDIIGLSATIPTEREKSDLLRELGMRTVYTMPLDESVERGLVSPYRIIKVEFELDSIHKNVSAGTRKNPFMTTEKMNYDYLTRDIEMAQRNPTVTGQQMKFKYLKRMRFIYDLKSKEAVAKAILAKIPENERTLIFAGTIRMAESLEPHSFHSETDDIHLERFMQGQINRLSCVKALNEGMNIPNVDNAVIVQVNSKERHLIQKIGRAVRYRDGHTANIYIIYAKDTVDENWVEQATRSLNLENVKTLKFSIV